MAARLTTYVIAVIVAASVIAGLIVGAQRDDNDGPVDVIVHNAAVYTASPRTGLAEAVAIRGNQVLRVGTDRDILRLRRPQTIVIDAKGAAVLPGFNDTHVELIQGGTQLGRVDLLTAESVEDVERRIQDWAEANPAQPWVIGRGWHAGMFPAGLPTRLMLDRLVPDRPAQLFSADGDTAWVNTRALHLAKIGRRTASPSHGTIGRDTRTGEPSGLLHAAAMDLVSRLIPPLSTDDRRRALQAGIAEAHRFGVTSVQDVRGTLDDFAIYAEARRTGALPIRIYSALPLPGDVPDDELDRLEVATARYPDDPLFKAGAVSVRVDAAAPAAGAGAPITPGAELTFDQRFDPDVLNRLMRRLDARGWQIFAEASSERGVAMTLDAYAHAARSNPDRIRQRRHRIQNAMAIGQDDLPRLNPLGVLASMQFPGAASSGGSGNLILQETAQGRVASLASSVTTVKGRIAFGTGWPAAALDPLPGLRAAVEPVTSEDGVARPRLSLESAIDAYTSAAAWASFDEQRKGAIAPGMLADLVVLSQNIFTSRAALPTAQVELTIFDGRVVYRRAMRGTN